MSRNSMVSFSHVGPAGLLASATLFCASLGNAAILWSDLGATLVHESGPGNDILGGVVKRDDAASDTLYFKFHVDPHSDWSTEEYFAGFQLFEGETERLGVGNSQAAWAYSAFRTAEMGPSNQVSGDFDLHSSRPEPAAPHAFFPYELPRRGIENTIVFKVHYVAGADDEVTVWLNPDLSAGATEASQLESRTTTFRANVSFNEIHLRHGGGGEGWTFSDMAIATSFSDFLTGSNIEPGAETPGSPRGGLPLTFRSWQREQGLPQNPVRALAQTRDGYIWVGSDDGVARFDGVRFVAFGLREGLRSGSVRVLFEDSQGALWIGTAGGGLTRWHDGQFATFTMADGLPSDSVTALAEDGEKRLWAGTEAGLAVLQNRKFAPLSAAADLKTRAITTLFKDSHGVIWAGAAGAGIFRLVEGKLTPFLDVLVEGLLQDPHCLLVDRAGRVWVGAGDDFVLCRDGNEWRRYRISRHLAKPYVTTLAEGPDGTVWAGSVSEGLFQFKAGKLAAINARSGLSDNFVQSLLADREGNLWAGTGAGLNRLRPQAYGFPTLGVGVAEPRGQKAAAPAPIVVLEEALVDGVAAELSGNPAAIKIAPGKHRVEFRYTGLSFSAPERVRFRYRLEGLDPDWVGADTRRTAFYGYVPPGQYRFHVTACNSDGVWNEAGASLALTVLPHFWQAWWFIGLGTLGVLLSVGGGVRVVEKRKHHRRLKQLEQERALERERARIARDLHDDLGSSLARISLLSGLARTDKNNPTQVETHVDKISQSANDTVRALEEIVWAVRPGSDSLQSLVEYIAHFANEFFEDASTRCRLDLPHDLPARPLPPEVRHNIFLVVKEALTNVLKHASAREVRVQAKVSANALEILVHDDGHGFNSAAPVTEATRHGLGNMRRRAEAMDATLTVQSAPGKGTTVRLEVKLPATAPTGEN